MLLALRPSKFADNPCKKFPGSMDNLSERAKSYIQMEEISRFKNEVRHAGQKHDKQEGSTKNDSHKLDTRHKPDKHQPLPKGPRVRQDQILQIPLQLRPQHKRLLVPQGQDRRAHAGWEHAQRARHHLHIESIDKVPYLDGRDRDYQGKSKASTTMPHGKPESGTLFGHQGASKASPHNG
ncbi:hypothetical protein JHK82_044565 [Glycine max]|nr:hypothetical protein JHK82_044565 [Glycine max]